MTINHQCVEIASKDPEVQPVAELRVQAHTLQERYLGACAQAPRQKGTPYDRWLSRYQLDGIKLAHAS